MDWIFDKGIDPNNFYGFVYLITNLKAREGEPKLYIGRRMIKRGWQEYYGSSKSLKADIELLGKEHFLREIIGWIKDKSTLEQIEIRVLKGLDAAKNPLFYNKHIPGEKFDQTGISPSEETRQKISKANKGQNNSNYGKRHSPEIRKKISEAVSGEKNIGYGKRQSPEHIAKRVAKMTGENNPNYGKHPSEETRRKIAIHSKGENNNMFGKKHSPETLAKMSEVKRGKPSARKGTKCSKETKKKMSEAKKAYYAAKRDINTNRPDK